MGKFAQVRRIIFNDEQIGMGFNSHSGLAVGEALEEFTVDIDTAASGQEVVSSISIVNSHEQLMDSMGMSMEAQGRYGFFSGAAKATFVERTNYNSSSTFLVAQCLVQNPMTRGHGFKLKQEARALLDSNREDEFQEAFGDSFVRGLQTGGEFYTVIRITSTSTQTQTQLAAKLQAEYNGLVTQGSFELEFNKANESASTRSEFTATMYQLAGSGADIAPTVSVEEAITRFKSFPSIAKADPGAYEAEVATWDTLPLPLKTPTEREDFLFALTDARARKLRYIQTRNDLEFALQNPTFFDDLPPSDVLIQAASSYATLINAVMRHGQKLARGDMPESQIFDPGKLVPPLTEPAPIPLRRKIETVPNITIPSFIGLNSFELDGGERMVGAFGAQAAITGMHADGVGIGQDSEVAPVQLPRDVLEFFELVSRTDLKLARAPENTPTQPDSSDSPTFVVTFQIPAAGSVVIEDTTLVLHFQAVPNG